MASEDSEQQSSREFWKGFNVGQRKERERQAEQERRRAETKEGKRRAWINVIYALVAGFIATKLAELVLQ